MAEPDDKVAFVTGGGRGIGRAIALALAEAGAAVAVAGRNGANLAQVAAEITERGGRAAALPCDVADGEQVGLAIAQARAALGPIQILVNNAGITASVKFTDTDDATWERIMRVNATGPFWCCRAVVPDMIARKWGRIVNIASIAGLTGLPYSAGYSASKHALLGLTRSLALELGRHNITANALCPGWVETDMLRDAIASIVASTGRTPEEARASVLALSQQRRVTTPEEVAAAAMRLVGPEGASINGQAITIE
ncbi:MAG TPA: SDR family oxidoreductase [Roseiflexaceae bacterium]|nr:SDR family oxidoreductase [Roseiflexaceae bacterium]